MLQIQNKTPFESKVSLLTDQHGSDLACVAVKGTFAMPLEQGEPSLAGDQIPIIEADEHFGDPSSSPIKYPTDVVLGKMASDIGLVGTAYAPQGREVKELDVGVAVGAAQKRISLKDESAWAKRPVEEFGFVPASNKQRAHYAGTYDEEWQAARAPLLPEDFDLRFFNCACEGLAAPGFLSGGEPVRIVNLAPRPLVHFNLPQLDVTVTFWFGSAGSQRNADIWTLVLEPDSAQFYLVWGTSIAVGKQPSRLQRIEVRAAGEFGHSSAGQTGGRSN